NASNFSEGLAIVSKDGKLSVIDKNGKVVISCK
ncbi:MAG: WG repeat-containing protein, partial [Bacteroidales bacterium]|nr:WG repeat-containing protein [Bacteroidales bacterium]